MASIHEHKNTDTNASPIMHSTGMDIRHPTPVGRLSLSIVTRRASLDTGIRTVSHLPGGVDCTNCYLTNKVPCDECLELDYETKSNVMTWDDFKNSVDLEVITNVCGDKIPDTYQDFCELIMRASDDDEEIPIDGYDSL